ncbi:uncharacterized protein P174DRAFT_74135 [Aspergillus novofumigatus IBT 16806]|uniref:Uncharacterized protein n=1 Tax=Aspergillus novofumigatus (strain IBT 16806) TaxID=1392255 RepID=A0A2I1BSQ7_ASPN1|nr:uncharacterized protein P174DRAFT_74135 [Aspergillus novofumigatus IBT 16806]PKX88386.1 hypothetical protein P174DRAFT_74135 [Aspergillus novofumigatus IBT 16806]
MVMGIDKARRNDLPCAIDNSPFMITLSQVLANRLNVTFDQDVVLPQRHHIVSFMGENSIIPEQDPRHGSMKLLTIQLQSSSPPNQPFPSAKDNVRYIDTPSRHHQPQKRIKSLFRLPVNHEAMVYSLVIGDVKELVWNYVGLRHAQVLKTESS